jgi:SAM-dependent methyltransferase
VPVRVVAGHTGALPAEDGAVDAAVASLVLCSVADVPAALAEIRRVLGPGGELRFFEHVRSAKPWFGLLQDALTPVWSRAGGGCHLNRDTAEAIRASGFEVEHLERFFYAPLRFIPPHAHILGRAARRADPRQAVIGPRLARPVAASSPVSTGPMTTRTATPSSRRTRSR